MKRRDLILAIVIIGLVLLLFQRVRNNAEPPQIPDEDVSIDEVESNIEDIFGKEIPDDVEKAELQPIEDFDGQGIVTRDVKAKLPIISLLVDLPDAKEGETYQGWVRVANSENMISIGTLEEVKGGWTLDYGSNSVNEVKEVLVSSETKVDTTPEKILLKATLE